MSPKKKTAVIIDKKDIDDDKKLDEALDKALDALFGDDNETEDPKKTENKPQA